MTRTSTPFFQTHIPSSFRHPSPHPHQDAILSVGDQGLSVLFRCSSLARGMRRDTRQTCKHGGRRIGPNLWLCLFSVRMSGRTKRQVSKVSGVFVVSVISSIFLIATRVPHLLVLRYMSSIPRLTDDKQTAKSALHSLSFSWISSFRSLEKRETAISLLPFMHERRLLHTQSDRQSRIESARLVLRVTISFVILLSLCPDVHESSILPGIDFVSKEKKARERTPCNHKAIRTSCASEFRASCVCVHVLKDRDVRPCVVCEKHDSRTSNRNKRVNAG